MDATLKAGDVQESVTVTAEVAAVQFNTAKLETTVDTKLANNMPQYFRTPFLLAQLDPAVEKDDYNTEYVPSITVGGTNDQGWAVDKRIPMTFRWTGPRSVLGTRPVTFRRPTECKT
jgi:hypothetical protein